MGRKRLDLIGKRFGALAVISSAGSDGQHSLWSVKCDCGSVTVKLGKELNRGKVESCGRSCEFFKAAIADGQRTHGMSRHPAFAVWRSMQDRCRLPAHQAWKNYGGRGISVCTEWDCFENFWRDMGPSYVSGLTLDRRNNNGGYSKSNCRWVTYETQANNRRGNILILTPKGEMTVAQTSRIFGIGVTTLLYRIDRGWPVERLLDASDFHNRIE